MIPRISRQNLFPLLSVRIPTSGLRIRISNCPPTQSIGRLTSSISLLQKLNSNSKPPDPRQSLQQLKRPQTLHRLRTETTNDLLDNFWRKTVAE